MRLVNVSAAAAAATAAVVATVHSRVDSKLNLRIIDYIVDFNLPVKTEREYVQPLRLDFTLPRRLNRLNNSSPPFLLAI